MTERKRLIEVSEFEHERLLNFIRTELRGRTDYESSMSFSEVVDKFEYNWIEIVEEVQDIPGPDCDDCEWAYLGEYKCPIYGDINKYRNSCKKHPRCTGTKIYMVKRIGEE